MLLTLLSVWSTGTISYREALPSFRPARTRRECHVHKCDKLPVDEPATGRSHRKKGHMEPMGLQQRSMPDVPRVTLSAPSEFYLKYVAAATPVVIAGAAANATGEAEWTDEFLESTCHLSAEYGGQPWRSIIEVNKIIVSNTRYPLKTDWNFCDYVRNYLKPEHQDGMYVISALTDPGVQLGRHVQLPSVLACPEIVESIHESRLWMSSGNTSSSLHFDTHENLMLQARPLPPLPPPPLAPPLAPPLVSPLASQAASKEPLLPRLHTLPAALTRVSPSPVRQVFGTKSVWFWPPSQSHKLYMDYHDRFGLSPVNPDAVDLDHWPMFANLEGGMVAHLGPGDALLIPDGWWHQVRAWGGRVRAWRPDVHACALAACRRPSEPAAATPLP